jgi:outer membrane immunogenic protein
LDTFDLSGGLIGGTVGYNWQFGQAVIGAEGDLDWSGIKGTSTVLCLGGCETRNKWLATARGRLGFAFDRFLPYFTGGLALGDINATRPGLPGGSISNVGWTVGAGLEVGLVSNVSVRTSTADSIALSRPAATSPSPATSFAPAPTCGSESRRRGA